MTAFMIVTMDIADPGWIEPYFAAVPALLAEYGAVSVAGSRDVACLEGDGPAPDRVAVFTFPSLGAINRFMADPRYQHFRALREAGATSRILVFDNAVSKGELV